MPRKAITLLAASVLAVFVAVFASGSLAGCRRRAPGACATHADCDPGYDCASGTCVRRPPVPGSQSAPALPEAAAVPVAAPLPSPAPSPSPLNPPPSPPPPRVPRPPVPSLPTEPTPSSPDRTPMWKLRLKDS
jgi:hypothetical protein